MTFKTHFCGNKISEYGRRNGFVDYATFAKAFDAVLNNDIIERTAGMVGSWDLEQGYPDCSEEIEDLRRLIEVYEDAEDRADDMAANTDIVASSDYWADFWNKTCAHYIDKQEESANKIEEFEAYQDEFPEAYQYYIVSDYGARMIMDYTNDLLWYNDELDMYVWGVTHWGTSWDYVLTDIPCEKQEATA